MKIAKFLKQSPDFQIHLSGKRVAQAWDRSLAPFDLSLTESLLLIALYFEEGRSSSFDKLTEAFGLTKGGLSQVLTGLEEKKLLKRKPQEQDRRSFNVFLEEKAHATCVDLIRVFDSHQRRIETEFGEPELQNFLSFLQKLNV